MQNFFHDPSVWRPTLCSLWALFCVIAGVAVLAPGAFQRLGKSASRWVETKKALEVFDRRYDVDQYVAPHCRLLGMVTLAALAFVAVRFW